MSDSTQTSTTNLTSAATPASPPEVGGRVWNDTNDNGIQDVGEIGVAGVSVSLWDYSSVAPLKTVSDSDGNYRFSSLPVGGYVLSFDPTTLPTGYQFTLPYQGEDRTLDSDVYSYDGGGPYITVAAGQSQLNFDAGISDKKGSIGDKVWLDSGVPPLGLGGATAPGVSGVTVTLYQAGPDNTFQTADDVVVGTQVTDANGNYLFTELFNGLYQLGFTNIPSGYGFTNPYASSENYSMVDPQTGRTTDIFLGNADAITDADAGLRTNLGSISGIAWDDLDGDGYKLENIAWGNPPGVANLTVKLYQAGADQVFGTADDVLVATKTTDADGKYVFGSLQPGDYQVEFSLPNTDSVFTSSSSGNENYTGYWEGNSIYYGISSEVNSDIVANTSRTAAFTVTEFKDFFNIDAGITSKVTRIGDYVWEDSNGDGVQNTGEPGLAGVTVELTDPNGTVLKSVVTGQDGSYAFDNITPGDYAIHVVALTGYLYTAQNVWYDTATGQGNSRVDSSGNTSVFTFSAYQKALDKDAGLVKGATVGDTVWNDQNNNGIQDAGEPGIAGATVILQGYGQSWTNLTTYTDANGKYSFTVAPGNYQMYFQAPAGYVPTLKQQGTDTALDSDINSSGWTSPVTVTAGNNRLDIDAGFKTTTSIGDKVWIDGNGDGLQNSWEEGAGGVTIELLNEFDEVVNVTATDVNGHYTFAYFNYTDAAGIYHYEPLTPGNYRIHVTAPEHFDFTQQNAVSYGATPLENSKVDSSGYSALFSVDSAERKTDVDAGLQSNFSLGDKVWEDVNKNGIQDAGEPGIAGVEVALYGYNSQGGVERKQLTQTDANGHYQFDHVLYYNDFQIQVIAPRGYTYTAPLQGTDVLKDSDVNQDSGLSPFFSYDATVDPMSYDAGLYKLMTSTTVGDRVWLDENCNGIQDGGEWNKGIAGVTVKLLNAAGTVIATQTTGTDGSYLFNDVAPGDYKVKVDAPTGYVFSAQNASPMYGFTANSSVDNQGYSAVFSVATGDNLSNKDAGLFQKASIGNLVWNDTNVNGIQDSGEAGLAGVTVKLLDASNANNFIKSVVTDSTGHYSFDNLDLGNYTVQVMAPAGYDYTYRQSGSDQAVNSKVDAAGYSSPLNIWLSGINLTNVDAGLFNSAQKGAIGDRVWEDANCNGFQDEGEWNKGIAGVKVELLSSTGTVLDSMLTDSAGHYMFKNLDAGDYKIHVVAPANYYSTTANQDNGALGNSVIDSSGLSPVISLAAGQTVNSADAGFYRKATLGNLVWDDTNQNGIQDTGERGLGSVPVQLFGWIDNQMYSKWAVTDANGYYRFDDVGLGNYTIQVEAPTGYTYSPAHAGTNTAKDSNVGVDGLTDQISIWISGLQDLNLDAGLYLTTVQTAAQTAEVPSANSVLSSDSQLDSLLMNLPATDSIAAVDTGTTPSTASQAVADTGSMSVLNELDNYANQIAALS